mmetsp:Transcript_55279/g.103660  ORF Transcript_55279/g.103660 Transcript_55279/m.103660 type:complete len:265 (+) Transcript_55279:95-889(+)
MAVTISLLLAASAALAAAGPCSELYGAEGLTCAWEQDVKTCMQKEECAYCSGEECQLCQEDTERVHRCCEKHYHSAPAPLVCESAAITEAVKNCVEDGCLGCSGEACQLCQEDKTRITACCILHDFSDPPQICKQAMAGPCDDLEGTAFEKCQWEQEVTACVENRCAGCSGEQCQACRESDTAILACCDENLHSTEEPVSCKVAFGNVMEKCVQEKCKGCSGEPCQLCLQEAQHFSSCCSEHGVSAAMCEANLGKASQSRAILP